MDYLTVTQTAYYSASAITLILLILFGLQSVKYTWKRPLLIALTVQFLSLAVIGASYSLSTISTQYLLLIELCRLLSWFISLTLLLHAQSSQQTWPLLIKFIALSILALCTLALLKIKSTSTGATGLISLSFASVAVLLLVYTEQVVRNAPTFRLIKLLGAGLFLLFAFDAILYGQIFATGSLTAGVWQAKAGISFIFSVSLALGSILFSDDSKTNSLSLSRPIAFYSTTAIVIILVMGIISSAVIFVNQLDGYIGSYLFIMALVWSLVALSSLIFSKRMRQNIEVFLNKHFFSLKYDYRTEWLTTSKFLANLDSDEDDYYSKIINFYLTTLKTEQGCIWIQKNGELAPVYSSFAPIKDHTIIPTGEDFVQHMIGENWIYVPHTKTLSLAQNNELLPDWIKNNPRIWVIAPLMNQMKLIGLVILYKPFIETQVTFEDRDLITNISTQVASHILLHQQEGVISDAKQLETYNRLSAFIMHDVNNVIAQLALIGKNAERHRENPAFIDDMIKTVHNSVNRMQELIQKFNPAIKESLLTFPISKVIEPIIHECSDRLPKPSLTVLSDFKVQADPTKLSLALKNLIRNAQDATLPDTGIIRIVVESRENGTNWIIVEDNGKGMSENFIEKELFKPFASTKTERSVGIGAYLTRSYLEHISARLAVKSVQGVGTKFEVLFASS